MSGALFPEPQAKSLALPDHSAAFEYRSSLTQTTQFLTAVLFGKYSSLGMLIRGLSLAIIIALVGVVAGASANDGSWVEGNMPLCCKKARSATKAPEVSMARLCCKLNCSEPGSGGSSNASNLSRNQGTTLATAIIPTATQFSRFAFRNLPTQVNHSHDPKYIQHLALLI